MRLLLLFFLLFVSSLAFGSSLKKKPPICFPTSERCVPQTAYETGITWKDCADYCSKCKGRETGKCEKSRTPHCKEGFHCKCHGAQKNKSDVLKEAATCRLGL